MLFVFFGAPVLSAESEVQLWRTTADLKERLSESAPLHFEEGKTRGEKTITIDPAIRFQTILGLGSSFEDSTCSNLFRLAPEKRTEVIRRLVHPTRGIGMNLMRICMGTSDFAGVDWYSYDEVARGEIDPELRHFSIERDRAYILPVLKEARRQNTNLLFFASPWSPPGWMKTTGTMIGGELLAKWYSAYAQYFVKFVRTYEAEGIPIHAVTIQNEPGVDRAKEKDPKWFYPSCHWTAEQERNFIRDYLGPALREAGVGTEIWCYDHNYNMEAKGDSDGLRHPRAILQDPKAAAFVSGVAFHHYEGQPSGMSLFHSEFPRTPIYFTEGSVFSVYGGHDIIERLRNWACSYNAWVTILDEKGRPNNGPFPATIAILRLHSETLEMEELLEFYNYAHFTKFIQRGARRIESTPGSVELNNIAFANPDGSLVLVAVNTTKESREFGVNVNGKSFHAELAPESIVTFRWSVR